METKANYTLVGFFTLAVIAASFAFVYWMVTFGQTGETAPLEIRLRGSASGLAVGAPVLFNGVRIGSVKALTIDSGNPNFVVATTEVRASAPVYSSTRVRLGVVGLTGQAHFELSGGDIRDVNILAQARRTGEIATLNAEGSSLNDILLTSEEILMRADAVFKGLEEFVDTAQGPLMRTAQNAERFSETLAANTAGVDKALESIATISTAVNGVSGNLESLVTRVDMLLAAVEPDKVRAVIDNVEKTSANVETASANVADASSEIRPLVEELRRATASFAALGNDAGETLGRLDTMLAAVDPARVSATVDNIAASSAEVRKGVTQLAGVADTIAGRSDAIDRTITQAEELVGRLSGAAGRVDSTLGKLEEFLGAGDVSSLSAKAEKTLTTFRQVIEQLEARFGPILLNLQRFSDTGLRDFEALVQRAQRSMGRMERAVTRIGDQPQSLIFGARDRVKRYDDRRRR